MAALAEHQEVTGGHADGVHALAAGRLLARRGEHEGARAHLERAVATLGVGGSRPHVAREVEALLRLAALHKAAGRRDLAAPLWHEVVERPGAPAQRAYQELAIYYERHARDLPAALEVIDRALEHIEGVARLDGVRAARWREALLLRRSRVHSRLERSTS
jgi:tetratricopeptide (TPR) repeat protein